MAIELDFAAVLTEWPLLVKGVAWTLGLTAVSAVLGVLLGIGCAWVRTQGPGWSRPGVADRRAMSPCMGVPSTSATMPRSTAWGSSARSAME